MRMETSFQVERPIEETFDYLADVTNEAKWNPWARWVRKVSEGPIQRGSVFRGSYKGVGELDQDLSVYDRPRRVVYHATPRGMREAAMIFELEPADAGTRLTVIGEAHPKGLLRVMEPMMRMRMRPHLRDVQRGITRELGPAVG